ncbi:replication protein [Providencia rettgeri]|uniref:replication protein n=1 Tax=Providencia rettgeri TaxID=587 RepID=UPI001C82B2C4|nr:replication protein [Providencia rettgeri]
MSNVAYADFGNQRRLTEVKVNDGDDFIKTPRQVKKYMMSISNQYLTYRQYRIIDAIIDKTCGWHKDFDRITNTQITEMIKLHHTHVSKEISELIERKILIKQGNKVGINKNINEWILEFSQNSQTLAKSANKSLAKTANEDKPNQLNTIDTYSIDNKDNKNTMSEEVRSTDEKSNSEPTKQDPFIEPFEKIFWIAGMRKVGKDKSKTAFKSKFKEWRKETGGSIDEFAKFLADDIQCRLRTQQFGFDKMHPTTYLNGSRWTDEKPELSQSTTQQSSITVSKNGLVFY